MKYPFVEIRFILNDNSTSVTDHTLDLKWVNDVYVWNYHDPALNKHHVMYLDNLDEVLDALTNMVRLLSWDSLPFKSMQVTAPAMPPIMISMNDAKPALHDIYALLKVVLSNPPVSLAPAEVKEFMANDDMEVDEDRDDECCADDEDNDENNDEDKDEDEDEFADLPPLIPISPEDRPPAFCTRSKSAANQTAYYSYFS